MASIDDPSRPKGQRIMALVEWYPPAFEAGGPIRSVHNLMQLLKAQTNHSLEVVCGATDLGSDEVLPGITPNERSDQGGVAVTYTTSGHRSLRAWRKRLQGSSDRPRPDMLYLNSVFGTDFALRPLWVARSLGIRVVLAPRGMLGRGALQLKPAKKRLFLALARALGWFQNVEWHASTEQEKEEVLAQFPQATVHVALNVPLMSAPHVPMPPTSPLKLLMLGRIHPIKNLHFALKALSNLDLQGRKVEVALVGPAEDGVYLNRLLDFASMGLSVRHLCALPPEALGEVWAKNHALLMPTTHENFGHAVVEAWAHGRPVLLSDRTPWKGLREESTGWDEPLDLESWERALQDMLLWDDDRWAAMSKASLDKHRNLMKDSALVADNVRLFEVSG